MPSSQTPKLPTGVPPWEKFSGGRVGIIAGALAGAIVVALGVASIWPIFGGGILGGAIGFGIGKRRMQTPRPADEDHRTSNRASGNGGHVPTHPGIA